MLVAKIFKFKELASKELLKQSTTGVKIEVTRRTVINKCCANRVTKIANPYG